MKRTCNKCKALQKKILGTGYYCRLYHPIQSTMKGKERTVIHIPLEDCEKPTTEKAFIESLDELK